MQSRIKETLILAVAVIFSGILAYNGFCRMINKDRSVTVRGLAEREVPADKVFWSVSFSELGNEIVPLYHKVREKDSIIVQFFMERGLPREDITIDAQSIEDAYADRYRYQSKRPEFRYTMTSTITVASSKVELARTLQMEVAVLAGTEILVNSGFARYEFTGLNDIKPEMIGEATRNARQAAENFAKDSQSKIGNIREASQGVFSIEDRDDNTPTIKKVRVVTRIDFALD